MTVDRFGSRCTVGRGGHLKQCEHLEVLPVASGVALTVSWSRSFRGRPPNTPIDSTRPVEQHEPASTSPTAAMGKSDEKDDAHTIEPFACVEAGEKYKLWRRDILALSAKYTDDSGSSCADYLAHRSRSGRQWRRCPPHPLRRVRKRSRGRGRGRTMYRGRLSMQSRQVTRCKSRCISANFGPPSPRKYYLVIASRGLTLSK